MSIRRWAVRTIRHGRVKIGRLWFRPSEQFLKYDGRLDGLRYMFGRYITGKDYEPYVCLWGSGAAARDAQLNPLEGPHCVDGRFPWEWWNAETKQTGGTING